MLPMLSISIWEAQKRVHNQFYLDLNFLTTTCSMNTNSLHISEKTLAYSKPWTSIISGRDTGRRAHFPPARGGRLKSAADF